MHNSDRSSNATRWNLAHKMYKNNARARLFSRITKRSISVLPTVSKLFQRLMDKQIVAYVTPFLFVRLLEKLKISLDEGGKAGTVLMDLSMAFDCIRHDLLIVNCIHMAFLMKR